MPAITTLPIIDPHHHLWDLEANYHPWLRDEPMIPFRYGDYTAIRKRFMPVDYRRLTANFDVVASVTVEGEFDETDLVAESEWMSRVAAEHAMPAAHIARTYLHLPGAPEELSRHAAFAIVRGIRHKPAAAPSPAAVEIGAPASMSDPAWQHGYAALQENGLHFELQTPWWHVGELMQLIERFPDTPVIINHAFMPTDRSPEGLAGWRAAIELAATAPGVTIKISGIGINGKRWTLDDQRPVIDGCIDAFGPSRCMFASNFPVDGLVGSFDDIYNGFLAATADLPHEDRLALFHNNAIRHYRLEIPLLPTSET